MNFLRPVYTDYLFKQLQKKSLNVCGSAGQGRERLLADLQELAKPAGILVLIANMKARGLYQRFNSPACQLIDCFTFLTQDECEQELQRRALGLLDEYFRLLLPEVYLHSLP